MKSRGKELVGMRGSSGMAQLQNAAFLLAPPVPPSPSLPLHLAFAALAALLTWFNFQRSERRGKEGAK